MRQHGMGAARAKRLKLEFSSSSPSTPAKSDSQPQEETDHPSGTQCVDLEKSFGNDPSAGSPTETLLRLLLPLSDKVH